MMKSEEATEARVAELEAWYTASQDSQRELLKRIARADRLAEVVARRLRNAPYPDEEVAEALAAYRSPRKEGERDEEV